MNQFIISARILRVILMLSLMIFACFAAARAQTPPNITTFVCTEPVYNSSNVQTHFRAYFGYHNRSANNIFIPVGPNNYFSPDPQGNYVGQPINFLPGFYNRVFFLTIPVNQSTSWILTNSPTTYVDNSPALRCGRITYQGRLSDGAAQANGSYDLRFTFYDTVTGGVMQGGAIVVENVPVSNGIFTVQLDVDSTFINKTLNPRFLEIAVRPGAATGNDPFTALNPRQPLTSVPYAVNAQNAANAANADNATNATNAVNAVNAANATNAAQLNGIPGNQYLINSGDGTINGNLNVTGTITTGCRAGFTAISGGHLCVSAMQTAATFYGASGAVQTCVNLGARVGTIADVTLTLGVTGFNYFGGLSQGWLGDYAGDNLRPVWNAASPTLDFDGAPLNVYTGAILPYRCVY